MPRELRIEKQKREQTGRELPRHILTPAAAGGAGETIAISKRDETVAFLIPRARLEALIETVEVVGNPAAMRAILRHESGKLTFHPLIALDEGEG